MAASDYEKRGTAGFCPIGYLGAPLTAQAASMQIVGFRAVGEDDLSAGMGVMIGDEILRLESIVLPTLAIKRGAADTIPAAHAAGSEVWFFTDSAVGDEREYLATDTIGVKLLPFSASSGAVPIDYAPPMSVTFNWRAFRPYPPGNVKVNGDHFALAAHDLPDDTDEFVVTWAHRDRLTQADQLIGHEQGSIGPEVGTSYTVRVYDDSNTLVRTVVGITGTSFVYTGVMLDEDEPAAKRVRLELCSMRDGLESLQKYSIVLRRAGGLGESLGENLGG